MAELDISGNSVQLDCSVDSGICVDVVTKDLKMKLQEFKRILFILERDKEVMRLLRDRLSRIAERKLAKKNKDGQSVCNVCFAQIDIDDSKTCIACCSCAKNVCRGEKCSEWVPKEGEWQCQLCAAQRDSYGKASTWVEEQNAVKRASHAEFSYGMRARSEIYIPVCDPNESAFLCNFESVSEAPSPVHHIQKKQIREYIEEVLADIIGGSLETATVEPIPMTNGNYQQVRNGHELQGISNVRLRRLIESIIAETVRQPPFSSAGLITTATSIDSNGVNGIDGQEVLPMNGNHCNGNGGQYFESKKYQDLLATAVLNKIVTAHGNGRHSESSPDLTSSSLLDNNHNAVNLTKTDESISSSSSVEPRSESSLTDPILNINKNDDLSPNNFYDDATNDNIEADRESVLSDFISSHMVPLPHISAEPGSYEDEDEEDEDFISVTSSRDATWEDNWLFKKKKSNKTSSTVGMLVPAPKEDIRALIGDKPTDEVSDLSEVGSDTDDSSLEMVSASLEPLNDRVVNKHLIGGKNTKVILDELVDRTSMISTSSLPDNVPPYTETKNEFVVSNDGLNESQPLKISVNNCSKAISNEAINSNVSKPIATKVEKPLKNAETPEDESIVPPPNDFTDDEKMRNLLAKFNEEQNNKTDSGDDNSSSMSPRSSISCALSAGIDRAELDAYEGITDFSVEDEEGLATEIDTSMGESSSRRPSVIEILAAIALGPMLAVSASDDRNILTEVELSSLMELNELAMAQMSSKSPEERRLGVIVEESSESSTSDDRKLEIIDVSEEDDLLSSPKMVMDAIRELVGKDAIRSGRYSDSSVQIEEITESSDQHDDEEVDEVKIEEFNENAPTSLSDDLGFEKIIAEDTSSISDESLHTIGSSSSSDDDFEGDTSCYFSDVKSIQEQSKETDGTVNEFILPPPTAFCDEQSKKEDKEEAHINSEVVQTDTQIDSEQPRTEIETHTEDTQNQTVRKCDDNEINQVSESTEMTENIQSEPETKEETVEVSVAEKVTVVEVHHHSEEPIQVTEEIQEPVGAFIVKECLPQSDQLQEPPDRKSEQEIDSKSEVVPSEDNSVAQYCDQQLVEQQSSADSKVVIDPQPLKVLSEAKLNEDQLTSVNPSEEIAVSVSEVLEVNPEKERVSGNMGKQENTQDIEKLEDQHQNQEINLNSVEINSKPNQVPEKATENEQNSAKEVSEPNLTPSEIPKEPENTNETLNSDGIAENVLQSEIVRIENKSVETPEEVKTVELEKSDEEHSSESMSTTEVLSTITNEVPVPEDKVESNEGKPEEESVIAAAEKISVEEQASEEDKTSVGGEAPKGEVPEEEISKEEGAEVSTESAVEQIKTKDSTSEDKCTEKEDENKATEESSEQVSDATALEQIENPESEVQASESEVETVPKEDTIKNEINDVEVTTTSETEGQTAVETVGEKIIVANVERALEELVKNISETQVSKEETTDISVSSSSINEQPQDTVATENTEEEKTVETTSADATLVSSELTEETETSSSEVVNSTETKEDYQEEDKKEENVDELNGEESKLILKTPSKINSTESVETLETADVARVEPFFSAPEILSTEAEVSSKLDSEVEAGKIVDAQPILVEEEKVSTNATEISASETEMVNQIKPDETVTSETKPLDESMEVLQEDKIRVQSDSKTEIETGTPLVSEEISTETIENEPTLVTETIDLTHETITQESEENGTIAETEKETASLAEEKSSSIETESLTNIAESEKESVELSSKISAEDKIAEDQTVLPDIDSTVGEIETVSANQAESSSNAIPTPEDEIQQLNEPSESIKEDDTTPIQTEQMPTDDKVSETTTETDSVPLPDEKVENDSVSAEPPNKVSEEIEPLVEFNNETLSIEQSPVISEEVLTQAEENKCEGLQLETQEPVKDSSTVEKSDKTQNPQVLLQISETTGEAEEKVIEVSNSSNDEVIKESVETATTEAVTTENIEVIEQIQEQNGSAGNTKDDESKENTKVQSITETNEEILDDKINLEFGNSTSVKAGTSSSGEQPSESSKIDSVTPTLDEKVEVPETEEKNHQTEVTEVTQNELPITPTIEDQEIEKTAESSEEISPAIVAPAEEENSEGVTEEVTTDNCAEKENSQTEVPEETKSQLLVPPKIEDQEIENVANSSEIVSATVSDISSAIAPAVEENNEIVTEETIENCSKKDNLKTEVPEEAKNEIPTTTKIEEDQAKELPAENSEQINEAVSDITAADTTTAVEENNAVVTEETIEHSSEETQNELSTTTKIERDQTKEREAESSEEMSAVVSDISTATAVEENKGVTEETVEVCAEKENSQTDILEEAPNELSATPKIEEDQTKQIEAENSREISETEISAGSVATTVEEETIQKSAEQENLQSEVPKEAQTELSVITNTEEDQTKEKTTEGSEEKASTAEKEKNEGCTEEIKQKSDEKENLQFKVPEEVQNELSPKIVEDQTKEMAADIVEENAKTESDTSKATSTPITEESNDSPSNDVAKVSEQGEVDRATVSKENSEEAKHQNNEVQIAEVDKDEPAKEDINTAVPEECLEEKRDDKIEKAKDDSETEVLPISEENSTSQKDSKVEGLPECTTETLEAENSTEAVAESLKVETVEDTQVSVSDNDAKSNEIVAEHSSTVSAKIEEPSIVLVTEASTAEGPTPKTLEEPKENLPETESKSEEKNEVTENQTEQSVSSNKDDSIPLQIENKRVLEPETEEIPTEIENSKQSADTVTEENPSQETSTKDDNTLIEEVVKVEEETRPQEGDTDSQEKVVEAQNVLEEVSTENVSEKEKASEISNEPIKNIDEKKFETIEAENSIHLETQDNQITDSSSPQLEKANEIETVEKAKSEESTTIIESKKEEEHKDEKRDVAYNQTRDSSCEEKDETSNKLEEASDVEVKAITEEILPSDEVPQSIESKEEETMTKEEVTEDSRIVTEPVTETDNSDAEKEQLKDDNLEKKDDIESQIPEESKTDQATQSESDPTLDAPLLENEVQIEENIKCQEQIIEESCPVSKTEDEQIQSIPNMNETTLKTDDAKTEDNGSNVSDKHDEDLKVEDQETTSDVPNDGTSNALQCTKHDEEVTCETSGALPIPDNETTSNPTSKDEVPNLEDTATEVNDVEVGENNEIEDEVVEEVKKVEENNDAEEVKAPEDVAEAKEVEEVKEVKNIEDVEEVKNVEEVKDVKEPTKDNENKDVEEPKEPKEPEDLAEVKEVEEVKEIKNVEEFKNVEDVEEVKNVEEVKDVKEPITDNENKDVDDPKDPKEPEDVAEVKEVEEIKIVDEVKESVDVEEVKDVEVKGIEALQVTEIEMVVSSNEVPEKNITPSETTNPKEEEAKETKSVEVPNEVVEVENESTLTEGKVHVSDKVPREIEETNTTVVENSPETIDNKAPKSPEQIDEEATANNVTSERVSVGADSLEPQEQADDENKTNENLVEEQKVPLNIESQDTILLDTISETVSSVEESQKSHDSNKDDIVEKELKDENPIAEEVTVTEGGNIPDSTTAAISATEVSSEISTAPEIEKKIQSNNLEDNTVPAKITEDVTLPQTVENETVCSGAIVDESQDSITTAEEVLTETENSLISKEIPNKEEKEVSETVDPSNKSETVAATEAILPGEQAKEADKTVNEEKEVTEMVDPLNESETVAATEIILTEEQSQEDKTVNEEKDIIENKPTGEHVQESQEDNSNDCKDEVSVSKISVSEEEVVRADEPIVSEVIPNSEKEPNQKQDVVEEITTASLAEHSDETITEIKAPQEEIPISIDPPSIKSETVTTDESETKPNLEEPLVDDKSTNQTTVEELTTTSTVINETITPVSQQIQQSVEEDVSKNVTEPEVFDEQVSEVEKNIPKEEVISKQPAVLEETAVAELIDKIDKATTIEPPEEQNVIDEITRESDVESSEVKRSEEGIPSSDIQESPTIEANRTVPADVIEDVLSPVVVQEIEETTKGPSDQSISMDETGIQSEIQVAVRVPQEERSSSPDLDTHDEVIESSVVKDIEVTDSDLSFASAAEELSEEMLPLETKPVISEKTKMEVSFVDVKADEVKSEVSETSNTVEVIEATLTEEIADTKPEETVTNENNEVPNQSEELLQPAATSTISEEATAEESSVVELKVDEVNCEVSETSNTVQVQEVVRKEEIADTKLEETVTNENNEPPNQSEELLQPAATSAISKETTTEEPCVIDTKVDQVTNEVSETLNVVELTPKEELADTKLDETNTNVNNEEANQPEEPLQLETTSVISETTAEAKIEAKTDQTDVEVSETSNFEEVKEEAIDPKLDEVIAEANLESSTEKESKLDDLSIVQEVLANVIDSLQPELTKQVSDGSGAVSEKSDEGEALKEENLLVEAISVLEATEVTAQETQSNLDKAEEPPGMDKCNDAAHSDEKVDPQNTTVNESSDDLVSNIKKEVSVDTKDVPTQDVLEIVDSAITEPAIDLTNPSTGSEAVTNNAEEQQPVQIDSQSAITESNTILADSKSDELIVSNDQNEPVEALSETDSTSEAKQKVAEVLESTIDSNDLRTSTTETEVHVEESQNVTSKEETKVLDSTEIKENETVPAKEVEEALEVTEQTVVEESTPSEEGSTVETKIIDKADETSEQQVTEPDAETVDNNSSNEVKPPIEVLTATCKIITHPPLEKTESLIASAQYLYEKLPDPILEPTPEVQTPSLAEELRMADTIQLLPKAECVIPQTISCESRCFASDPQPANIATATEEQSNAQDVAQGSIAEREYKKWYNAVDMPNNPYSVEALRRRLSGGPDRVLDLPNISPCIEDKPLQLGESLNTEADNKGPERDYARYSRDYYINDAKHASGITKKSLTSPTETPSPTPTASSIELDEQNDITPKTPTTTPVKELCHKLEKQVRIEADLYLATPVRVIEDIPEAFADALGTSTPKTLTTEAVSRLSSDTSSNLTNASLTPSEDSDTIRIYDLKKQETRLVKESTHTTTITVPKSPEKKIRPTELNITPTLGPALATISSKSSTPTSFKFLQPKRKLINPSQVLSIDQETVPITPNLQEKPVIEAEVVHAMPSVKALARAFLMTSTTTSSSENKWRKARAKSPLQFFKLSTATVQKQEEPVLVPVVPDTASQGSEDATIASDLSSLETDPPSRIEGDTAEANENQERVVLSGCLRNNIAFFENLKNK